MRRELGGFTPTVETLAGTYRQSEVVLQRTPTRCQNRTSIADLRPKLANGKPNQRP